MPNVLLRFHDCEVDLSRFELRRLGRPVRLEKIPMELLIFLAERRGELITREEILQKLWGKDVFLDVERAINTAIYKIRMALHDDPEAPRFVQTVVGKGYRFLPPVEVEAEPSTAVGRPEGNLTAAGLKGGRAWRYAATTGALLLALALALLWNFNPGRWRLRVFGGAPPSKIQSLAVLPLENLSRDTGREYFADGMTEELITDLAKIGSLRVISRTSVMAYKGKSAPIREIGRQLGVDAVVEGAVLLSGNRVRITAQLIDARTDLHLWANSFEGDLRDVLAVQDQVARNIAREVQAQLTPADQQALAGPPPVNPEAYDAYLKGRFFWNRRTELDLKKAIEFFNRALAADPAYAAAESGLADCYMALGYASFLAPRDSFPLAEYASRRALALDPNSAEAHASLAYARLYYDWDWAGAERGFHTALRLDPRYVTAHEWYGVYLTAMTRFTEAESEMRKAHDLDPLSVPVGTDMGFELYYSGQYDRAAQELREALEMNPSFPLAHLWLGRVYQQRKMYSESVAEYRQAAVKLPDWSVTMAAIGNVEGLSGQGGEARQVLRDLKAVSYRKYVTPYGVALVYAGLGDKDSTFAWLSRAIQDRSHWLVWLNLDPRWGPVRHDPRFKDLLRRMNFPS